MKIQKIEAGEVWAQGKRVGLIIEEWFYPVPDAQLSAEELSQIALAMVKERLTQEQTLGRLDRRPIASDMADHISEVLRPGDTL